MKNYELLPSEENVILTLEEDILFRNQELVNFYNLLTVLKGPCTVAIDGRWGSGKTFFVKQEILLINSLNSRSNIELSKKEKVINSINKNTDELENCDLTIYYDAWKNDNDYDPIFSLLYEITSQLSLSQSICGRSISDVCGILVSILDAFTGKKFESIVNKLKTDDPLSIFKERKELENRIQEFFSEILIERGNRLIVFIDELDRCNPSFAVKLLEQIKHYLVDEKIIFVFSVNLAELQHTVKSFYGNDFDASRYLDRFFDIRIALPPADKSKLFEKMGIDLYEVHNKVIRHVIENMNMELREISRFYLLLETATAKVNKNIMSTQNAFSDGKGRHFIYTYIVPLLIGLHITDISLYSDFINGKNSQPLEDLLLSEDIKEVALQKMLSKNESFFTENGKRQVSYKDIIQHIYQAIFVEQYVDGHYYENIGEFEFSAKSKALALQCASMISTNAEYKME